jgi:flagellar biosynthetic protein FliR
MLGAALGLAVRMVLALAEMAGELAGMSMGLSFMQIADPLTREVGDGASRLLGIFGLLLFLAIDGHHALVLGLGESLAEAPLGTVLPRATCVATLVPLLSSTIAAATRIAAPVVVALLLTNAALALLARAAPQLNIFTLSFGITVIVGLVLLATSLAPSLSLVIAELRRLPSTLTATLGALDVR